MVREKLVILQIATYNSQIWEYAKLGVATWSPRGPPETKKTPPETPKIGGASLIKDYLKTVQDPIGWFLMPLSDRRP